jgi:hypothetical protein
MTKIKEVDMSKERKVRTVEEAKAWGKKHEAECLKTYAKSKDIPDFLRSPRLEVVWITGCWLNEVLAEAGATKEQSDRIGFCHGQRCMFQDPWETAVAYAHEFEKHKTVKDQPGIELANSLNERYMGVS